MIEELLYYGSAVIATIVLSVFGRWLYKPYIYTKDITDIGYNHVKGINGSKNAVQSAIARGKRIRKIGAKIPPPFPNGWFKVVDSADLKCGKAQSVDILGQNLVVFRTEKGEAHVFDAYCPHLGANLGVGGIVKGDCIECPFHQWVFRGSDGECVNVPYSLNGNVPKSSKLKKWISCEINDVIFVWHHAENADPWTIPTVPQIDAGQWQYYGKNEFLINCHIQEIPENGADVAHLNAVHSPNMFAGSDLRYTRTSWASCVAHAWNAKWEPCVEENKTHTATMNLTHSMKLFDKFQLITMDVCVKQVGPGYVQLFLKSTYGEFVILQTVVPIEPLVQLVVHRFYFPRGMSIFAKFTIWGESVMFERDMMVWNHKRYVENPILLKEDRMIKAYRNWFGQFYSENSRTFADAKQTLEW